MPIRPSAPASNQDLDDPVFQQVREDFGHILNLPGKLTPKIPLGFAEISFEVRDVTDTRLQVRQNLRSARELNFVGIVNSYLDRARDLVRRRGYRDLVVILDQLDRLNETPLPGGNTQDERLFLTQAPQLRSVGCHVLYTVRLSFAHRNAPALDELYGSPAFVPMTPVRRRDGSPHHEGLAKLVSILDRRLAAAPDASAANSARRGRRRAGRGV